MKTLKIYDNYFKSQGFDSLEHELNEKFSKGFYISDEAQKHPKSKAKNYYEIHFKDDKTADTTYKVIFSDNSVPYGANEYTKNEETKINLLNKGYTEACKFDATSKYVSERLKSNIATVYKVYVFQKENNKV